MGKLRILTEESYFLRRKCREVGEITPRTLRLLNNMAETMYAANGCGLAAPQVGTLRRVVVIDIGEGLIELINPVITEREGNQRETEGCLSLPGKWGITSRPAKVKVRALNRNGEIFETEGEGLLARAFCHELDHLDGKLFTDEGTLVSYVEE